MLYFNYAILYPDEAHISCVLYISAEHKRCPIILALLANLLPPHAFLIELVDIFGPGSIFVVGIVDIGMALPL